MTTPMCSCTDNMDIRGRCNPFFYKKEWKYCPFRYDSAYEFAMNDSDIYRHIEKVGITKCKTLFKRKFKITDDDWIKIINLYNELHSDDTDDDLEDKIDKLNIDDI